MAGVPLHPKPSHPSRPSANPLPQLLHTPSGLALLEIQGTINLPDDPRYDPLDPGATSSGKTYETAIGRLVFPDHNPAVQDPKSTIWMKRVHLYVGKHQRVTGEVKKLPKPVAVIRRRPREQDEDDIMGNAVDDGEVPEELEVVEIIKYKILFSQRPEPVGTLET